MWDPFNAMGTETLVIRSSEEFRLPWYGANRLTMRILLLVPVVLCSLHAQAERLKVKLLVSPGRVIFQQLCADMVGTNAGSALTSTGANSFNTHVEKHFPGSVSVSVSGGVPPYRYDWHGLMADASTCSALPGVVRITVSDAEGNSVSRTALVSATITTLPSPCGTVPLLDPDRLKCNGSGDLYFGSAKARYRSNSGASTTRSAPVLRTGHQYIPPGPPQGGGQKPTKLSSGKLDR